MEAAVERHAELLARKAVMEALFALVWKAVVTKCCPMATSFAFMTPRLGSWKRLASTARPRCPADIANATFTMIDSAEVSTNRVARTAQMEKSCSATSTAIRAMVITKAAAQRAGLQRQGQV